MAHTIEQGRIEIEQRFANKAYEQRRNEELAREEAYLRIRKLKAEVAALERCAACGTVRKVEL